MPSIEVKCETYKVKAEWSQEMITDLNQYSIDIEKELEKVLQEEIMKSSPEYAAQVKRDLREKKLKRIYGL